MDVSNVARPGNPTGRGTVAQNPVGVEANWPLAGYNQDTKVGLLAGLLSNDWLGERHIDTLVAYLNDRFQKSN